ncbi:hypothetical protein [Vibrio parahaemolyticus]|uniref:hypothetical protein n=1 Tax=Vibrio parahaemolyticus TaxID=670 RepID=UPI00387B5057|nr:hypothetical protein [Vibrio vulnificus]HCG7304236.1 hypothetical protein [Vibrio parahaemolyticus]
MKNNTYNLKNLKDGNVIFTRIKRSIAVLDKMYKEENFTQKELDSIINAIHQLEQDLQTPDRLKRGE